MTRSAPSLRLLLLLLALTGVAGMHTIGHSVGTGHGAAVHASAATSLGLHGLEPADAMSTDWRADEHDPATMTNPLDVCLAVLLAGILLLVVAMLCRIRRGHVREHIGPAIVRAGRGPPGLRRLGLTLADLSVQRA